MTELSRRQVATMRRRYATGNFSQVALAREYDVSQAAVSRILRGKSRRDVGGPLVKKGEVPRGRKLTPRQVAEVAASGESCAALGRRYGVTRQAIQQLKQRWEAA